MSILKILRPKPLIIHLLLPRAMYRFSIRKQALLQCNFLQKKKRQETSFFPGVSLSRKTNIYAKSNNDN